MPRNPSHKTYERRWKDTSKRLAKAALDARLFIGVMPAGISYADKSREEHGDYKRLAFLSFHTGELEFYPGSDPFRHAIQRNAATMPRGSVVQTSACGQTAVVGSRKPS